MAPFKVMAVDKFLFIVATMCALPSILAFSAMLNNKEN